jgi:hypothetical protein
MKKYIIAVLVLCVGISIASDSTSTVYHCLVVIDGNTTFKKIELPDYNPFSEPKLVSLGSVRGEEFSLQNGEAITMLQIESATETKTVSVEKGRPIYYHELLRNLDVLMPDRLKEVIVSCEN